MSGGAAGEGREVRASDLKVVILAGGRGERFWPFSRRVRPKPLLDLGTGRSMLQETFLRASRVTAPRRIRTIAAPELIPALRRELRGLGAGAFLVEPAARNTGPACLLASSAAAAQDRRSEILVLPSDHRVEGSRAFRAAVRKARLLARRGFLVTFGVRPSGPDPGFGYIVPGDKLGRSARRVRRFVEKPGIPSARVLLKGRALWNSGMFLWRSDVFLQEAARVEPAFRRWLDLGGTGSRLSRSARLAYLKLPDLSVDRAVLERSDRVAVIPARFAWSDLGTWSSIYDLRPKDRKGNAAWGKLLALDATGSLAVHPTGLTVLAGVKDLLVVCAGDAVLVCDRSGSKEMKAILRRLRDGGFGEYL